MDPRKELQESLTNAQQKLESLEQNLKLEDVSEELKEQIKGRESAPLQRSVKDLLDEQQEQTLELDEFTEVEIGETDGFVTADYKRMDPAFSRFSRKRPALASMQVESGRTMLSERALDATFKGLNSSFYGENGQFERLKRTAEEKSSPFFNRLFESMEKLKSVLEDKKSSTDDIVSAALLVSEYANSYYDTHRGHIYTDVGKVRKNTAMVIRDSMSGLFENLLAGMNVHLPSNTRAYAIDNPTKAEKKRIDKSIGNLGNAYVRWGAALGKDEIIDERAHVRDKLRLLMPYEGDIAKYKLIHQGEEMPYVIRQYDLLRRQVALIDELEKNKKKDTDEITKMTREYVISQDEQKEEKELPASEIDQGLTESQLEAIDRIDQWFVRNAYNGGMLGTVIKALRNEHGDIINELFRKSKRERLFIYYLIEKGKRKSPSTLTVWQSQSYVPDLDAFRDRMKATKLKVTSWVAGGYTYMSKLSDAMQANKEYKDMIKDGRDIAVESEEEKKAYEALKGIEKDKLSAKEKLTVAAFNRKMLLKKSYNCLSSIQNEEARLRKTKAAEEKQQINDKLDQLTEEAKKALRMLVEADNEVGNIAKDYNMDGSNGLNPVSVGGDDEGLENLTTISEGVGAALGKMSMLKWGLGDSGLAKMDLVTQGGIGALTGAVGQASAMLLAVFDIVENAGNMHAGDIAQKVVSAVNSLAEGAKSVWEGVEQGKFFVDKAAGVAKTAEFTASSALQVTGIVTSGVSVAINGYSTVSSMLDHRNATKASRYLAEKHKNNPETKETRYEKNMIKLAKRLSDNKAKSAALNTLTSTVSLVSVAVPGLGVFLAPVGIGLTLIGIIREKKRMSDIRTKTFDDYFGFEGFFDKVKDKMTQLGRKVYDPEAFKDQLRRKLAAAAGYADMFTAMNAIAVKYAELIHNKLFVKKDYADNDEKEGYIQMIKSFGLPFNEEKGKPDKEMLIRKMSGR